MMRLRSVCIGVYAHSAPAQLEATLAALCAHTPAWVELLLLPDGPDAATTAALERLRDLPQQGTVEPRGTAACFNRLVRASRADMIVLLESGALAGPEWFERLEAAINADARNGLAGPSTNRCRNEQAAFAGTADDADAIAVSARAAAERFADTATTLDPLHGLADFCYAVTRATIETVGMADEGYGLGPCWEMDYNIRAARLGIRGVWAGAAYVHRLPPTPRRHDAETRLLTASRQRYEATLRALGPSRPCLDDDPACRDDSCEPLPQSAVVRPRVEPEPVAQQSRVTAQPLHPLISCIMPTRDRPEYALQAVRYFQRQDYPNRELIVVDDGAPGLQAQLPDDARIRYEHHDIPRSIGAKRNYACSLARGEVIAQWDDDDWYAPGRLSAQSGPLLADDADITGLVTGVVFELDRWRFWRCSADLHRRMFVENVHGGTLVYRRRIWERGARYPDRSLAEDAALLRQAVRCGARLRRLPGDDLFVYVRHGANSWSFACGDDAGKAGWIAAVEPPPMAPDRDFYLARSSRHAAPVSADTPLVSCIMPTAGRREYAALAARYFQRQDYPNRELVVVDDGHVPIVDLMAGDPRIRYVRLDEPAVLGEKRNIACQMARGTLICHWDDDDWMAPHRVSYEVAALERSGAQACGSTRLLYYDPRAGRAWLYRHPAPSGRWVAGNTLLYQRALWARRAFDAVPVGEDTRFIWRLPPGSIHALAGHHFYVGLVHAGNTAPKRTSGTDWQPRPLAEIRALLGDDVAAYGVPAALPHPEDR